jgi:2-methylcitrate dehydratase PrpD
VIVNPGVALKKYACCYASHRGMDGVLALKHKHAFHAEDIVALECRMPPGGMQVLTYPVPRTGLEGKFSLEYALAAGALDGRYTLWSFTDEAVRRPAIRELLKRVRAHEVAACRGDDPEFEKRSSGSRGYVEVEVELAGGARDAIRIDRPPGHPARELTWDDLHAKFSDCAAQAGLAPPLAAQAFERLTRLEQLENVTTLIDALC